MGSQAQSNKGSPDGTTNATAGGATLPSPPSRGPPSDRTSSWDSGARDSGRGEPAAVLVGREREIGILHRAFADAVGGSGRLVLITGEPGIGKTRMCEEVAAYGRRCNAQVVWGRCFESAGAPPFWPWTQILRESLRHREAGELRPLVDGIEADLLQLLPALRAQMPEPVGKLYDASPETRFRLFDSVVQLLTRLAHQRTLVLVLDDLHGADGPSLSLLEFVARALRAVPLLVVGTYRSTVVPWESGWDEVTAELLRESTAQRLVLSGLSREAVARFVSLRIGATPPESLVTLLHKGTEGNPLFLGEFVQMLATEGWPGLPQDAEHLRVPDSIQSVIRRRLAPLSPTCQAVLRQAAVIGREFDLTVLEHLLAAAGASDQRPGVRPDELVSRTGPEETSPGLDAPAVFAAVQEAVAARILLRHLSKAGRYRFSHAMIRETLYDGLSDPERIHLHQRVTAAMEAAYGEASVEHLAELAHHAAQGAARSGDVDKAIEYAARAARHANEHLAYESAVTHYERALRLLALKNPIPSGQRCDLLLALGEAYSGAGDVTRARAAIGDAVPCARQSGDAQRIAHAAVGLWKIGMGWHKPGESDEEALALLDEALAALGPEDSVLRARALIYRAQVLNRSMLPHLIEQAKPLSLEALAVARRTGDLPTLVEALNLRYWVVETPDQHAERQAILEEYVRLAAASRDPGTIASAYICRINRSLEIGDRTAAERDIATVARLAEEYPRPLLRVFALGHQAVLAQAAGRFADEQRLIEQLINIGQGAIGRVVELMWFPHMLTLCREQGRFAEIEPITRLAVAQQPGLPTVRVAAAWICAEMGNLEEARREFELLAEGGFEITWDVSWIFNHAMLATICAALDDAARAAVLYERLLPYGHLCVWTGGPIWLGSVALFLGMLARTLSRWEDAERHFQQAIATNRRIRQQPYLAYAHYEYAATLAARGRSGDREKALELLCAALGSARELGMRSLEQKAEALNDSLQRSAVNDQQMRRVSDVRSPNERTAIRIPQGPLKGVFCNEGQYWTITYARTTLHLKDCKGLQYLAHLLRHPGREFHATDVIQAASGQGPATGDERPATGDGGLPILDQQAKADYKQRLCELRHELDEAESFNDPGRAAQARQEIEFLTRQLSAAVGLHGHDRKTASASERARLMVTKRVKDVVKRIAELHPPLAHHLRACVKTGYLCVYTPAPGQPVEWKF